MLEILQQPHFFLLLELVLYLTVRPWGTKKAAGHVWLVLSTGADCCLLTLAVKKARTFR